MRLPALVPGVGFGDGSHPTTRLCLQALRFFLPAGGRMLDFGAGNGILGIEAALRGLAVDAVEIDPAAVAHARQNARLNQVELTFRGLADARGPYDFVAANILRAVLLDHAEALAQRMAPGAGLVLSGLVNTDVPEVAVRYGALLGRPPERYAQEDWRALVWRPYVA